MNLMKLAEILIDVIKRDYPDDVAIVHYHGSTFYNDTHDLSDLDLYFIPKTERGYNLACDFIFNGIGTDLWGISWERLEHIASHEERISSIITEGEVLYYGSEEDLARFEAMKAGALDTSDRASWLARAEKQLDKAYKNGFLLQNAATLSETRAYAIGLLYDLSFSLAQLNQSPIKRGRKYLLREILAMHLVPENFAELYNTIFMDDNMQRIKSACVTLLQNTEKLVRGTVLSAEPTVAFSDAFEWWYEEAIQSYNKIYHACETGDIYTPLFASTELLAELEDVLKRTDIKMDLPDLMGTYDDKDLAKIAAAARKHQKALEAVLNEHGVTPLRFSTFEEVENYLLQRGTS